MVRSRLATLTDDDGGQMSALVTFAAMRRHGDQKFVRSRGSIGPMEREREHGEG
jgi:hypothetical protein